MSSRIPGYLCGLAVSAAVATAPLLAVGVLIGMMGIGGPQWTAHVLLYSTLRSIPWIGESATNASRLMYAPLWKDHFVCLESIGGPEGNSGRQWNLVKIDPETGKNHPFKLSFDGNVGLFPTAFGDRLWLVDPTMNNPESFEVVDGLAKRAKLTNDPFHNLTPNGQQFLLEGEPALIESDADGFVISTSSDGEWTEKYSVVLPESDRLSAIGPVEIFFSQASQMSCLNLGDEIHVLLKVNGNSIYRQGLQLKPFSNEIDEMEIEGQDPTDDVPLLSEVALAPEIRNTADEVAGWTSVRAEISYDIPNLLFVNKEPAVLILDDVHTYSPIGPLYRFDGQEWRLAATQLFPFARNIRVTSRQDGMKSYISVLEAMGVTRVYSIDQDGIRATECLADGIPKGLLSLVLMFAGCLILDTALLGLGCWGLMCRYTMPDYEVGNRTVRLASLGQRGLARGIDIVLIGFLGVGLIWFVKPHFDCLVLVQALECQVSHPMVTAASELATWIGIWFGVIAFVFVAIQGRWGVTPGKWCVGIRVLRSTLRPCGFGRSLAREVAMCVDTGNTLWWGPGIFSVALTNARQRLGDLIADTIVIEQRSQ